MMVMIRSTIWGTSLFLLGLIAPCFAITVPATEDFSTGHSNWGTGAGATSVFVTPTHVSSGGPQGVGDGYISYTAVMTGSSPGSSQILFRGQDNFVSSGNAFVGNWIASGITEFSFWIRHNADIPLSFSPRLAPTANSPAYQVQSTSLLVAQPDTWTKFTVAISPSIQTDPNWIYGGAPNLNAYVNTFSSIAKMQILAFRGSLPDNTEVTFDLDAVSVVPEPSSVVLAGISSILAIAVRRRFRTRG